MPVPWKISEVGKRPRKRNPDGIPVHLRSMTLAQVNQLRDFLKRLCKAGILKEKERRVNWLDLNQYHINEQVIKKIINEDNSCSWMELVSEEGQQADTFISHFWGESFRDFALSIKYHSRDIRAQPDHAYWICLCANNQWKVTEELGSTLEQSPFYRAIENSKETLLMLDRNGDVTRRSWCLYEWHRTLNLGKKLTPATGMGLVGSHLVSSGTYIEILKGIRSDKMEASDPRDQRRIQNAIAGVSDESEGLKMIVRIASAQNGTITTASNHCFRDKEAVKFKKGFGKDLTDEERVPLDSREKYYVKRLAENTLQLFRTVSFTGLMNVEGGKDGNLVSAEYEDHWFKKNQSSFEAFDKKIKKAMLNKENVDEMKLINSRVDTFAQLARLVRCVIHKNKSASSYNGDKMKSVKYRAITLAQLRRFFQSARNRVVKEKWDKKRLHELIQQYDQGKEKVPGGDVKGNDCFKNRKEIEWENLTWYDIKYFVLMRDTEGHNSSYVEAQKFRPLLLQYHFTFRWDMNFSEFMAGIELLAEARQMTDTTPLLIYPLAINLHTKEYYDHDGVWKEFTRASESCVIAADIYKTGSFSDLEYASSLKKSIDIFCGTGVLALVRPFTVGSWEFGQFDLTYATKYVDFDVQNDFQDREDLKKKIQPERLDEITELIRLAGAGPSLRNYAYEDNITKMEHILKQCPRCMQSAKLQGPLGETPQHIAASTGKYEALKFLLKKGAAKDAIDFDGETPLHLAALCGEEESVRLLLDHEADAHIKSYFSETPLDVAKQKPAFFLVDDSKYESVIELLQEEKKQKRP